MPAGPLNLYAKARLNFGAGAIDLRNDEVRVALLNATYQPKFAVDATWADVSAAEVGGAGYSQGGAVLSGKLWQVRGDDPVFAAADAAWPDASITAKYAVLVRCATAGVVGDADYLIGCCDLNTDGGSVSASPGTFRITWSPDGIFVL